MAASNCLDEVDARLLVQLALKSARPCALGFYNERDLLPLLDKLRCKAAKPECEAVTECAKNVATQE